MVNFIFNEAFREILFQIGSSQGKESFYSVSPQFMSHSFILTVEGALGLPPIREKSSG